jgi:sugar/nucleoside kinase (ribokinase family)
MCPTNPALRPADEPGPSSAAPCLGVIGNAVQDVFVRADLPDLARQSQRSVPIRFVENDPIIERGTSIDVVRQGEIVHTVDVHLDPGKHGFPNDENTYKLVVGGKHQLLEGPAGGASASPARVRIPFWHRRWGGGGVNCAVTARSLAPATSTRIKYCDITRPLKGQMILADLPHFASHLAALMPSAPEGGIPLEETARRVIDRLASDEGMLRALVSLATKYTEESHLELYLALRKIDFSFFRSASWRKITNLVLAQIIGHDREIHDKVIFRGLRGELDASERPSAAEHLRRAIDDADVVLVNTVYDSIFFDAAIDALKASEPKQIVWAMTESTQDCMKKTARDFIRERREELFENSILIFNETEFSQYVRGKKALDQFTSDIQAGRLPSARDVNALVTELVDDVGGLRAHVFVTLGRLGSIGVLPSGLVLYMGPYQAGRQVHDTTGCGDAFAAGISLLALHKASIYQRLRDANRGETEISREFALLSMAVATAAAYSKATSPTNEVSASDVVSLLRSQYLPRAEVMQLEPKAQVAERRLVQPRTSVLSGYEGLLDHIIAA